METFVSETILESSVFKDFVERKLDYVRESCVIHIRNGDYLELPVFNCFDRKSYLDVCLSYINVDTCPHKADRLIVVSEDNDTNKKLYGETFSEKFKEVVYQTSDDILEDLFTVALGKQKIILNSTFAYWAAFIGNTYLKDYNVTFAPNWYLSNDLTSRHCNPKWNIMKVGKR